MYDILKMFFYSEFCLFVSGRSCKEKDIPSALVSLLLYLNIIVVFVFKTKEEHNMYL